MDLYICEKPSQAKDLAGVMKASQRGDGFLHDGGNRVITWAFGHLLELYMPDDYDERYKSWSLETLPIAEWGRAGKQNDAASTALHRSHIACRDGEHCPVRD